MARYCPNGDGAFEDWVERCPECGRDLIDKEGESGPTVNSDLDLVWLVTAPNQPEAEMWADTIRADGIPVLLKAGGPGFGAWASVSMFEHQLFVHRSDLRRARQLTNAVLDTKGIHRMGIPRRSAAPRRNPASRSR